jgi:hypothetical protein
MTSVRRQLAAARGDLEKELQSTDRGVDDDRRGALIDKVQLEAAQILDSGSVRALRMSDRAAIGR